MTSDGAHTARRSMNWISSLWQRQSHLARQQPSAPAAICQTCTIHINVLCACMVGTYELGSGVSACAEQLLDESYVKLEYLVAFCHHCWPLGSLIMAQNVPARSPN